MKLLRFLPLFVLFTISATAARAADGAFTRDGRQIYFATGRLKLLDLARPDHFEAIATPPLFGGEKIYAVARASDGAILCLSEHHLAALDPQRRSFRALYDSTAEGFKMDDLAVDPKTGLLLVTGGQTSTGGGEVRFKPVVFLPGSAKPTEVFSRRVESLRTPVFDAQGQLFFSCRGDLWQGRIRLEKRDGDEKGPFSPEDSRGVLEAERIAPLARVETDVGNSSSTGVFSLAVAPPLLYIQTQRMGGTGWGTVCTIPLPRTQAEYPDNKLHPDAKYDDFIKVLSSVKIVGSAGSASALCASPQGDKVFYQYGTNYLIEQHGKPRALPVKEALWEF